MKRVYLVIVALLALIIMPTVNAMPSAEANDSLIINKDYNDTAVFAGQSVDVNAGVNGLGLYAGNTVQVKGNADYGFAAGNQVTVKDYTTKDLFVAGNQLNIKDVTVRNIYAAGQIMNITADADDLYIAGQSIVLNGNYKNVYVDCETFELNGVITGKLYINEKAEQKLGSETLIGKIETYVEPEVETPKTNFDAENFAFKVLVNGIISKVISTIKHFVSILIIGFLFILLCRRATEKINESSNGAGYIFAHFGIGLGLLIFVPIIALLLLFTGFISSVGIVGFVLYFLSIYLSGVIGALYVGKMIFKNMNTYLRYFITLLILTIIYMIPIVGWIAEFFMLCFTLGVIGHISLPEFKKGK